MQRKDQGHMEPCPTFLETQFWYGLNFVALSCLELPLEQAGLCLCLQELRLKVCATTPGLGPLFLTELKKNNWHSKTE